MFIVYMGIGRSMMFIAYLGNGCLVTFKMIHDFVILLRELVPQYAYDICDFSFYLHKVYTFIFIIIVLHC